MRVTCAVLLALAACGGPQPPPEPIESTAPPVDAAPARGEIPCGDHTCGPDEYCENRCLCCGAYLPDPAQASGSSTCLPLPASCATADGPECQRTVDIPCA